MDAIISWLTSMYKEIIRPMLDRVDSETWHVRAREALNVAESTPFTLRLLELFADGHKRFSDERLRVILGGVEFDNPVMVGARWTKNAHAIEALYRLGFSGVEVGSVLDYPQLGNNIVKGKLIKPRQFMITPGVCINALGFNGPGVDVVANNLDKYKDKNIPIGISLGKNKDIPNIAAAQMHAIVVRKLYEHASYFAINVSSPNTPGLRELQDKGPLTDIVQAVNAVMDELGKRKPLFIKIAPDLTNDAINDVIRVVLDNGLNGIIATNTTNNPNVKGKYGDRWRNQPGGLSGDDEEFRRMSTDKIKHIHRETGGNIEIIGVGGINNWQTALEKIQAGAKVIQIVTAIRGEGPSIAGRINRGLVGFMERGGIRNISELVGTAA